MPLTATQHPPQVGEFQLERKIGQGGICDVYLARQPSLDRQVAIKILRPHHLEDPELRRRFTREGKILARLSHPNIIHVIDAGAEGDYVYYAMEFVEGIDFKKILQENKTTLADKLDVVIQTLKGLEYAHHNGVIHRDLKPANIMVDEGGNARLTDFGIAHLLAEVGAQDATQAGELMGTPAYMAPEQRLEAKDVDARSDIFSVGVILYEVVTGRKPYGHFKAPSELNNNAPPALDEIILKCLEPEPDDRFSTVTELKDRLLGLALHTHPVANGPEPTLTKVDGIVGHCRFLDTLSETTLSKAFLVENTTDKKLYVIKKIQGRNIDLGCLRRLSVLKHPHILNILGAGSDLSKAVVVLDYARGGSLADRLARIWNDQEVTRFLFEAASALDFAHKNDILHGNLRPSNILFDDQGGVLLSDFCLPPLPGKRKPWWRPPEGSVSPEGDLFSLGAMAYRMLFGDRPRWFSDDHLHFPKTKNFVPRQTRRLLCQLLHREPEMRCSSAEEVVLQLTPRNPQQLRTSVAKFAESQRATPLWLWVVFSLVSLLAGAALAFWDVFD